jgi:hypothetical protein
MRPSHPVHRMAVAEPALSLVALSFKAFGRAIGNATRLTPAFSAQGAAMTYRDPRQLELFADGARVAAAKPPKPTASHSRWLK